MVALEQLPVLLVVVPLLAAPVCSLLRSPRAAWLLMFGVNAFGLLIASILVQHISAAGVFTYHLGGWEAPWGIEYRVDMVNAYVLVVIALIGLLTALYAPASVRQEIAKEKIPLFYSAYLLCYAGLLGITITGDAFNVYVFLEISSLAAYALISMGYDKRGFTAAYRYLVIGSVGATFILIGIGLLYMMTGTLNMADLAERIPAVSDTRTIRAAFAFLTVGIGIKVALFPMHRWLPNAYTRAPSVITVFLSATATKVALYLLFRFFFSIFGRDVSFDHMHLQAVLLPLSVLAILVSSTNALYRTNLQRLLAYSSIAQIGYMTLGASLATETGLTASILHLFNHALMKGALFMAAGCMVYRNGSTRLSELAGMARQMPWTFAAFVASGLSLIGVPLTVGFISKWYLLLAVIELGWWPLAAVIVVGSLLAVAYIWKFVEIAWFHERPEGAKTLTEAPLSMRWAMWIMVLLNFYFGMNPSFTIGCARKAAQILLEGM